MLNLSCTYFLIYRTAKDIEILIESLPSEESSAELQSEGLRYGTRRKVNFLVYRYFVILSSVSDLYWIRIQWSSGSVFGIRIRILVPGRYGKRYRPLLASN